MTPNFFGSFCSVFHESYGTFFRIDLSLLVFELWAFKVFDFIKRILDLEKNYLLHFWTPNFFGVILFSFSWIVRDCFQNWFIFSSFWVVGVWNFRIWVYRIIAFAPGLERFRFPVYRIIGFPPELGRDRCPESVN